MKKFIFTFFVFYLFTSLYSQTTFNKEIWPMKFINGQGPLLIKEDTIICIGYGTDYYSYRDYYAYFAKYDMEGNFISNYIDSAGDYSYQEINDAFWDGDSIITILSFRPPPPNDSAGAYFVIIDSNTGKFLKKQFIYFPERRERYGIKRGITRIDSVTYGVVSMFSQENDKYHDNIVVSIINIKTEKIKNIELHRDTVHDIPSFIKWNGEKLLVGAYKLKMLWNQEHTKEITRCFGIIFEIDTSGSWREVYESQPGRGRVSDMIITDKGNYIISLLNIIHFTYQNEDIYKWHFNAIKLDKDFKEIWEIPWGLGFDFMGFYGYSGILKAEEGDGYILTGYQPNYPFTEEGFGYWSPIQKTIDSMKAIGEIPMTVGILHKISEEGDSIWMHSYSYVKDTTLEDALHWLKDVEHSPDGGYILHGEILHGPRPGIDTANQYPGWLVKVDRYGCLIPGCQDTTDTTGLLDMSIDKSIKIYPNPTSDRLYIYQSQPGDTRYTISDITGCKIQKWSGNIAGHTYILDVSRYKPGIYILTAKSDGKIRSGKFVVE